MKVAGIKIKSVEIDGEVFTIEPRLTPEEEIKFGIRNDTPEEIKSRIEQRRKANLKKVQSHFGFVVVEGMADYPIGKILNGASGEKEMVVVGKAIEEDFINQRNFLHRNYRRSLRHPYLVKALYENTEAKEIDG